MQKEQLADAGFSRAEWVPTDTPYAHGELYVRLTSFGTLRLFFSTDSADVELSSGSLYDPVVHYRGPLKGIAATLALMES